MSTASTELNIAHKPDIGRFEAIVDGLRCEADYRLDGHTMHMTHTGVPGQLEGRGIAAALVKAALSWARTEGHQVNPLCSYVRVYIKRHPEWQDLLA
ncbi:MAG: N-acetyltransferase [Aquabacterium sp.]|uniref:GNAT family N-acetyltransferase n=1 Tax=Aquabacterium sp. TaxID=1872578 RepID=UPI0025C2800B|nr:GNAT family N-acetyltransferase [Aquabacterium sp.]MBI5927350.1 N-acetyltransferase [Aquabacterium sp.]